LKPLTAIYRIINSHLRYKLMIFYICIIVIPLTISNYVTYNKFTNEIEDTYIANNLLVIQQLNRQLDDYLKDIDQFLLSFYNIETSIAAEADEDKVRKENERLSQISLLFYQKKEIESILYYRTLANELYFADKRNLKNFYNADEIKEEDWYQRLSLAPNDLVLVPTHTVTFPSILHTQKKTNVFTVSRSFSRNLLSRTYAVASINFNTDYIAKISSETIGTGVESVVYLDNVGKLFYHSSMDSKRPQYQEIYRQIRKEGLKEGHLVYIDSNHRRWMIIYNQSGFFGNIVYKIIPMSVLNEQAAFVKNFNLLVVGIVILILILASIIITYKITKPLFILERSMRRAGEGNFNSFSKAITSDEIGRMSLIFNNMLNKINNLITDKYVMELNYRMAQIKSLQAQINPHFLYNTLQSIGSVALQEGLKDLYKMVNALSGFLRYSIKSGGDSVALSEELKNTERYLMIQKFRYEDKLNYTIEVDDEVKDLLVPKLTLQPLVENAVIHGLEHKKGPGMISVACYRSRDELLIKVSDDGIGIEKYALEQIRYELFESREPYQADRLGLKNVLQRLKLLISEKCHIDIDSVPGEGTNVQIIIPIRLQPKSYAEGGKEYDA
jgi:two-component system, sensor histidine kinase YesM